MQGRHVVSLLALTLLLLPVFFEISVNPAFELPADVRLPDPEQEANFEACLAERDGRIHKQAFDTIDNPDVQREYISMHRDRARVECRERYPRRAMTVRRPFRINLFDLQPRFDNP